MGAQGQYMVSIAAAALGAALGAAVLGAASVATGDITGLGVALTHIPPGTHGYAVVSAVSNVLTGGVAGGGIGAAVSAVAKATGVAHAPA